jgi:ABC-type branched-subunit amino acid transport system substrate-binding protein
MIGSVPRLMASTVIASALLVQSGAAADKVFRVGWNAELSGPWTFTGNTCLAAAKLAEGEVNADGRKIELVVQDNQTNPAQAAAVSRALDKQEKVDLLSGPTQSDVSLAVYGYAEDAKVPYLVPVAAFPQLTQPGTKYTYRMEPDSVGWGYAFVKFIKALKPDATVGIMFNDFAINKAILTGFEYQAKKDGLKIVGKTIFPQTVSDATVQVAQMKALKPDYVMVGGGATAFDATLTEQLLDIGFRPDQLIHPFGSTTQILNWKDRSVGSYFGTFFDKGLPNLTAAGHDFVDNFVKEKGYTPGYVENYCYTTVRLIGDLVANGAHDRDSIHKALATANTKELTTGVPITFDQNGARVAYMYLMQIKDMTKNNFDSKRVNYIEWSPEVLPVYDLIK